MCSRFQTRSIWCAASTTFRVGGNIRANQLNTLAVGFQDGFWDITGDWGGDPAASLLMGFTDLAIHDQTFAGDVIGRRWKMYRPYIQDDWRVSKDLTLNLGLAWALVTPESEAFNRQANFVLDTQTFLVAGQGANEYAGVKMDLTALEPRIGLAWKPWGSQTTVVRGGYAIYPRFFVESWARRACGKTRPTSTSPMHLRLAADVRSLPRPVPLLTARRLIRRSACRQVSRFNPRRRRPTQFTGTIISQDLNFKQGRVQQFNVNVEHQLPGQVLLTVGYAGSRASHILVFGNNLNVSLTTAPAARPPGIPWAADPAGRLSACRRRTSLTRPSKTLPTTE